MRITYIRSERGAERELNASRSIIATERRHQRVAQIFTAYGTPFACVPVRSTPNVLSQSHHGTYQMF